MQNFLSVIISIYYLINKYNQYFLFLLKGFLVLKTLYFMTFDKFTVFNSLMISSFLLYLEQF